LIASPMPFMKGIGEAIKEFRHASNKDDQ